MKFNRFISLVFLLNLTFVYAGGEVKDCTLFKDDPFEKNVAMPKGKFKGECLDLQYARNFNFIEEDSESIKIANFLHEGKYWLASIPKGNIFKRAVLQVEFFPPEWLAAHTQIRFDLNDDLEIELVGQNETNRNEMVRLKQFVISFEAIKAINGPNYSLMKGVKNLLGFTARIFSLQTAYDKIVISQKHRNQQIILNFESSELAELFRYYVDRGDLNEDQVEMYHTLKNNCTTEIYDGFEFQRPMPTKKGILVKQKKKRHFLKFLPVTAKKHTKIREIFSELELPLEEEFTSVNEIYENRN